MRIPNLSMADAVVDRLNTLRGTQSRLNQQLATGQRVFLSSEDPQAVSRVMSLRSEMSISQQYGRNVDDASKVAQQTQSVLTKLVDICSTATSTVAQYSSTNASPDARKSAAEDINGQLLNAMELLNSTFNQQYIFSGTKTDTAAVTVTQGPADRPTGVEGAGAKDADGNTIFTDGISVQVSDTVKISPYASGSLNGKLVQFVKNLISLRDALSTSDDAAASAAVVSAGTSLKQSETDLVNGVAENGVLGARLDSMKEMAQRRFTDVNDLMSRETDVDIAQSMVDLTKAQTAYQAAMQAGSQILKLSLLDYIR